MTIIKRLFWTKKFWNWPRLCKRHKFSL